MSLEHTTRAITENKFNMQLFADKKTLEADVVMMKKLKESNPNDDRVSDYDIKQKEYELSQIESRIKGKDYSSVKTQCEKYFQDNSTLFDKNQIITETRSMLSHGQTVNEWPHLAAIFLLDHATVTDQVRDSLETAKPQIVLPSQTTTIAPEESISPGETLVSPVVSVPVKPSVTLGILNDPIAATTLRTDEQPESSRSPVPSVGIVIPETRDQPSGLQDIVPVFQEITKPHERFLTLSLEAIRDEVREAKKFDSFRWSNKKEKGNFVVQIEKVIKDLGDKNPKEAIEQVHMILKDAREKRLISEEQYRPILDLYNMRSDMSRIAYDTYRDAAIRTIRASNGTNQMNSVFYEHFQVDIDLKISVFTQIEKEDIENEVLRTMGKMNSQLNTIARTEWENNKVAIQKMDSTVQSVNDYKKLLVDYYTGAITHDLQRKLAIKLIGEDGFKNQDEGLWNQYDQAVDPLDKLLTISDESATSIANFVAYDLTSLLLSGGAAGVIGRGSAWAGGRLIGASGMARVAHSAGYLAGGARTVGAVTRAGIEGLSFTVIHAGVRNQQWFLDQPDWEKQVALNSLGFGLFRSAQSGAINNMFAGVQNSSVQGLVKMGLVVPAIITGVQVGLFDFDRIKDKDPSLWNDLWSNFLLMAALGGMFHYLGKGNTQVTQNADALLVQKGVVRLQNQQVPMKINQNGTITLSVKGKQGALKEVTFTPSKELQKQISSRQPTVNQPTQVPVQSQNIQATPHQLLDFTKREITATDVRRAKILIKNGEYPQFIGKDGDIWSIRTVTGRSGKEFVEIGPLGKPSDWKISIDDFVEGANASIKQFKTPIVIIPTVTPGIPSIVRISPKNYNDFVDDIWKFDKKSPDTRQLGDMVVTYDKINKRITLKKGKEPEKMFSNKEEFKTYILAQDESIIAGAMKSNKSVPKFESNWKIGNDKYLLTKEGKFYKNGSEMKIDDLSVMSGAEMQRLFTVLYESNNGKIFANTIGSKFSSGAKGALDGTWYIASTPWKTNGLMSIPAFFTNLVRLPFINARGVYEIITTSGMANTQKFKDIVKTLAFANKNGFDGFVNGSITTLTTAAILYSQYMYVQEKQANGDLPQDMSWAGEAWAITHRYFQSVNIYLPVDAWMDIMSPRK